GMLLHEGVQVKIIDRDRVKCDELSDKFPDAEIVCGDCTDKQLLAEEGLDRTDAFVCLTSLDEVNIMLSLYASSV
ncbi:MAG: NAD-binding protein, partial [Lachnospiraceae bacterium]|nr:NAD-binding protein [Lachnospiraceae bacterium]